jgi:hypothetical protein
MRLTLVTLIQCGGLSSSLGAASMWVSETNCPVPRGIGFGAELIGGSGTGSVSTIALLVAGKEETTVKSLNKILIRNRYRV